MGNFILHHEGAYNIYSSEFDRPLFKHSITHAELLRYIAAELGGHGLNEFPARLARAHKTGCSAQNWTLGDCISANRAGKDETELSYGDFLARFLWSPDEDGLEGGRKREGFGPAECAVCLGALVPVCVNPRCTEEHVGTFVGDKDTGGHDVGDKGMLHGGPIEVRELAHPPPMTPTPAEQQLRMVLALERLAEKFAPVVPQSAEKIAVSAVDAWLKYSAGEDGQGPWQIAVANYEQAKREGR